MPKLPLQKGRADVAALTTGVDRGVGNKQAVNPALTTTSALHIVTDL